MTWWTDFRDAFEDMRGQPQDVSDPSLLDLWPVMLPIVALLGFVGLVMRVIELRRRKP